MQPHSARFKAFYDALANDGLLKAVALLNRNVPHRYSAVYRLEGAMLHNHTLCDKKGETRPHHLASVPLRTSFCQFVLRHGMFSTTDSRVDRRLVGHPAQHRMVSYTGAPITEFFGEGEIIGSLCHFDLCSQSLDEAELELLQQAAKLIRPPMIRG